MELGFPLSALSPAELERAGIHGRELSTRAPA